jgi:hypothetical protein
MAIRPHVQDKLSQKTFALPEDLITDPWVNKSDTLPIELSRWT